MCDTCSSPDRRSFLRSALLGAVALTVPSWASTGHGESHESPSPKKGKSEPKEASHSVPAAKHAPQGQMVTPDEALQRLLEGNRRFVNAKMFHPNSSIEARNKLASGQAPFAAILGCADSRVPPELVFDHGLGDLFVVRVAGNIVEDAGSGSFEYTVEHLGTPLIVVLAHERCGAVTATVQTMESGGEAPGHLGELVRKIQPAVEKTKSMPGDKIENAVRENAKRMAAELAGLEPILKEKVDQGKLKVVAMRYDLDTGAVELL